MLMLFRRQDEHPFYLISSNLDSHLTPNIWRLCCSCGFLTIRMEPTMRLDPALIKALSIEPENTKVYPHGHSGFTTSAKICTNQGGVPVELFLKTGPNSEMFSSTIQINSLFAIGNWAELCTPARWTFFTQCYSRHHAIALPCQPSPWLSFVLPELLSRHGISRFFNLW